MAEWHTVGVEEVGEVVVGVDRKDRQQQSAPGRAQSDELKQGSSQGGQWTGRAVAVWGRRAGQQWMNGRRDQKSELSREARFRGAWAPGLDVDEVNERTDGGVCQQVKQGVVVDTDRRRAGEGAVLRALLVLLGLPACRW